MYILRARVIEGSIPMPMMDDKVYTQLKADNYEIFAPYTKDNLMRLFNIGKDAWEKGTLSKFEILAWAGGVTNHEAENYLWSFRPDVYNFKEIPKTILSDFDIFAPQKPIVEIQDYYNQFWKPLKYGMSLGVYLSHTQDQNSMEHSSLAGDRLPLSAQIQSAEAQAVLQNQKDAPSKEIFPARWQPIYFW